MSISPGIPSVFLQWANLIAIPLSTTAIFPLEPTHTPTHRPENQLHQPLYHIYPLLGIPHLPLVNLALSRLDKYLPTQQLKSFRAFKPPISILIHTYRHHNNST